MIKEAGIGVAFCSDNEFLNHHADIIISSHSFAELLNYASLPPSGILSAKSVRVLANNISKQGSHFLQSISNAIKRIKKN
jgi:hypothetical protein